MGVVARGVCVQRSGCLQAYCNLPLAGMESGSHAARQTRFVGLRRGPAAEVLHVTATSCVKRRFGDFTAAAAAEAMGISQRMYSKQKRPRVVLGCN